VLLGATSHGGPLDTNATYWNQYPSGDEVVKCWKDLRAEN
jgi:hypothetical protein